MTLPRVSEFIDYNGLCTRNNAPKKMNKNEVNLYNITDERFWKRTVVRKSKNI